MAEKCFICGRKKGLEPLFSARGDIALCPRCIGAIYRALEGKIAQNPGNDFSHAKPIEVVKTL